MTGYYFAVMTMLVNPVAEADISCWINSDKIRECGNIVPPEYSQQTHSRYDNRGILIETEQRAKTEQELAEEAIAEEKRQQIAEVAHKASIKDRMLLDSFGSVDDILLAKQGKLSAIENQITFLNEQLEKRQLRLDELMEISEETEKAGQILPKTTREEMATLKRQIENLTTSMQEKETQKIGVDQQFQHDLERYKELSAAK